MITPQREVLNKYIRSQIRSDLVYKAFEKVDRKLFVPRKWEEYAYRDNAFSLNGYSSISQPSLVAEMIDLLDLEGNEHVLEVGTASGYSAAILSLCCKKVYTIEIDQKLGKSAKKRLKLLGFKNIFVHIGDGSEGIPSKAPFDGIIVTAASREIPEALISQLSDGGRMVIPIQMGESDMQELVLGIKDKDRLVTKPITVVKFVPLVRSRK